MTVDRRPFALLIMAAGFALAGRPASDGQALPQPTVQETNDRYAADVLKQIAGREDEPAERVFRNVRIPWLKIAPARTFVEIMTRGYARALGVRCTHCHDAEDFSSDAKRPKRAAREMATMHKRINEELAKMKELEPPPDE